MSEGKTLYEYIKKVGVLDISVILSKIERHAVEHSACHTPTEWVNMLSEGADK